MSLAELQRNYAESLTRQELTNEGFVSLAISWHKRAQCPCCDHEFKKSSMKRMRDKSAVDHDDHDDRDQGYCSDILASERPTPEVQPAQ